MRFRQKGLFDEKLDENLMNCEHCGQDLFQNTVATQEKVALRSLTLIYEKSQTSENLGF